MQDPQQQAIGVNGTAAPYAQTQTVYQGGEAPRAPMPYRGELDAEGNPVAASQRNKFRTWWSILMCAFLMAQAAALTQVKEANSALFAAILALVSSLFIFAGSDKVCLPALVGVMQATGGLMMAIQGIRHVFENAIADYILRSIKAPSGDVLTPANEYTWDGLLILLRNSKYRPDVIAYLCLAGSAILTGITAVVTVFRAAWHATNPGAF